MPYVWPPLNGIVPRWNGAAFHLGDRAVPVLDYGAGASGWSDDLTDCHEVASVSHPIAVASRRRARDVFRRHCHGRPADVVIVDIGCTSGDLVRELRADWPRSLVIGADYLYASIVRLAARAPGTPFVRFDLVRCPLPSASVDGVALLNVLEHIDDDAAAIRHVARILKPGGVAAIEVPAGPHLYDAYDAYLKHCRRYRLADLCALIEGAGLRIHARSHLGVFVYPAFAYLKRQTQRRGVAVDAAALVAGQIRQSSGPIVAGAFALERAIGRVVRYPIGIRCVVTAVKP